VEAFTQAIAARSNWELVAPASKPMKSLAALPGRQCCCGRWRGTEGQDEGRLYQQPTLGSDWARLQE